VQQLGWGVIGIGNIVNSTIAPAMVAEPACDLVAAVSRDRGRADDFAERFGARHAYTDYEEMLGNPEVDAVFIATPNLFHAEQVVLAAAAGKHVLCDKPLAMTVPDAIRAIEACDRAGVSLGVNFHNRHLPWVHDVARIVQEGVIGEIEAVHLQVGSGPRHYDNWRADPEIAGLGSVHNVGVHGLDFLRVLLGEEATEVVAILDRVPGSGSVEMMGQMLIRFANGVVAYFNANERLNHPRNDIEIYGTAGRIIGADFTRSRSDGTLSVLVGDDEKVTEYPAPEAHRLAVTAFTTAVLGGHQPNASGIDGLRSVEICEAIARSAVEGRIVDVTRTVVEGQTAP
jgi:1,5-anhydro-D-fructose reductase (1,5-anhydro-D-mannitol-forming)